MELVFTYLRVFIWLEGCAEGCKVEAATWGLEKFFYEQSYLQDIQVLSEAANWTYIGQQRRRV